MRKLRTLFILGIWVAILSFLGFPVIFKEILFVLSGLFVSFIAYLFYIEKKDSELSDKKAKIQNDQGIHRSPHYFHQGNSFHENQPAKTSPVNPRSDNHVVNTHEVDHKNNPHMPSPLANEFQEIKKRTYQRRKKSESITQNSL